MFSKKNTHNAWENVYIKDYNMHYSRIIASYSNVGGDVRSFKFKDWMKQITDCNTGERVLTDEQINDIYNLATNGKLEWETDARNFLGLR